MRLVIGGGGTGGHLFPGLAVAQALQALEPRAEVLFIGTDRGLEARVVPQHGFAFQAIPSQGLKGKGPAQLVQGLAVVPASLWAAGQALRRFRPDVVLGVGGYSSGPVVLTARLLGLPTAVQEQNSVPGLTNRVLSRVVDLVFATFEGAVGDFARQERVLVVGNPVRAALVEAAAQPREPRGQGPFRLLVVGGSLGARGLNQLVVEALPGLKALGPALSVLHQAGAREVEALREAYDSAQVDAEVREFIEDMGLAYREADLVVCRAGATTVAELQVMGLPAVFVPFPHATDDHQARNAQALVDAGAALMFREGQVTGEQLARAVLHLALTPSDRARMREAALKLARPRAAQDIARALQGLAAGQGWAQVKEGLSS